MLGEVELENLPLKKDALLKFDLPIEVKSGGCNDQTNKNSFSVMALQETAHWKADGTGFNSPQHLLFLSPNSTAFDLSTGFIGKIRLQIPVSRLKSEPWVISMERLYLVAGPLSHRKVKCIVETWLVSLASQRVGRNLGHRDLFTAAEKQKCASHFWSSPNRLTPEESSLLSSFLC